METDSLTVKEKVSLAIQEYLEHTDTSDITENADYHGRILASVLETYLIKH